MFNTILNNGPIGIDIVTGPTCGTNTVITNNTVCGHTTKDINVGAPSLNTADSNTCGSSDIAGACDWNCDNNVPVYYDFDDDGDCSKAAADCSCTNPAGGKCACCNPGLFNSIGATQHCYGVCNLIVGNDPNDCNVSVYGDPKIPPLEPPQPKPDLVIQDKSETWINETHYNVSYKVCNIGLASADVSKACIYIDTVHQAGKDVDVAALAAGACTNVITVGDFECTPDTDNITVCADNYNVVDESDETNNCETNWLTCRKPDLTITDVHTVWVDQTAGTYNIVYTLENIGNATAPESTTTVRIDGPPGMDPPPDVAPTLAPGAKHTDRQVPGGLLGYRTISGDCDSIELFADKAHSPPGNIPEWNENNNIGQGTISTSMEITVSPPVDCVDGTFYVDIDVNPNGNQVYGVQYKLTYNPSVIYVVSQDEGTFLSHNGNNTAETNNVLNTVVGYSTYGLTRIDSLLGETTPGTLVRVKYMTIGSPAAISWINLSEVVIADQNANELDSALVNGSVTICLANQPPTAKCTTDDMYNNVGYGVTTFNGSESSDDAALPNSGFVWQTHSCNPPRIGMIAEDPYCNVHCNTTTGGYDPWEEVLYLTDAGGRDATCTCDVIVYIAGDANGDGVVNVLDASMTGLRWNKECDDYAGVCWGMTLPTPAPQDPGADMADRADLNNDCVVNVLDTSIVGLNWGATAPC
ncbi:MAG: hypothetical protein DRP93_02305 [Candidatus Neomarinimicrobiota bacterium]|nr:MAG: hypothetical protein DRP93_02305 [Candidatus Neomarinimicrobiota bacterium]